MDVSMDSSRKWGVLVAIGVGTFMTALDTSVANTVLPVIGKSFREPITNIEWVVTIYLLILSGLLLSFGRLGDMRGHKTIYLTGFGIFIAGSLFSGIAPNIALLITFRGLQALGAAMLAAN
jgi:MFS family permease